jgi:hypothetical protein
LLAAWRSAVLEDASIVWMCRCRRGKGLSVAMRGEERRGVEAELDRVSGFRLGGLSDSPRKEALHPREAREGA